MKPLPTKIKWLIIAVITVIAGYFGYSWVGGCSNDTESSPVDTAVVVPTIPEPTSAEGDTGKTNEDTTKADSSKEETK